MRTFSILFFYLAFTLLGFSQTPVDVAESTLKISGLSEEVFYYGFCQGDQILFSFQEVNGKELKEIEIIEYPSSSKYMDYKTSKIENKSISVIKNGIYKFRFNNSALSGRIIKYKIQRIPSSESSKIFNTNVIWKTLYDTSYRTVQETYLLRKDTVINQLSDVVSKLHSKGNSNGNSSTVNFALPKNTVSWSYFIGVDQQSQDMFSNATNQLSKTAGSTLSNIPGYGPMAALALGGVSYLTTLQKGEDVDFYLMDNTNYPLFQAGQQFSYYKKGRVISDFSQMSLPRGSYVIYLSNDNMVTPISVSVKVVAIVVNEVWATRPIQKMDVVSRQEPFMTN
jgi:hypothetical protein